MARLWQKKILLARILACLDFTFIALCFFAAILWTIPANQTLLSYTWIHIPYLLIFCLIWFSAAIERRLWSLRWADGLLSYLTGITKAIGDATILSVVFMALFTRTGLEHDFLVIYCLLTFITLLSFRVCIRYMLHQMRRIGYFTRNAILVGANPRTAHLLQVLNQDFRYGYKVLGVIESDASRLDVFSDMDTPYLGGIDSVQPLLQDEPIQTVFIGLPVRSHYENIQRVTRYCESAGVPVHLIADLFPTDIATNRQIFVEDVPLLSLSTIPEAYAQLAFKRLFDFAVSSALIVLLSPMFLLIALLIKLDSKGPLLFYQERVGQNQRRFKMIKFRSMVVNAEELREKYAAMNEADGPVFKIRNDPRITKVGRFIRKYSIDEFPQLFNVWWGEMSLVGPRPPIPAEVAEYTWDQRRRLSVKPGMTGLWQVSGRSDVNFDEWVALDLQYIDNWSIQQDFWILLRTFRAVVAGRGAA